MIADGGRDGEHESGAGFMVMPDLEASVATDSSGHESCVVGSCVVLGNP